VAVVTAPRSLLRAAPGGGGRARRAALGAISGGAAAGGPEGYLVICRAFGQVVARCRPLVPGTSCWLVPGGRVFTLWRLAVVRRAVPGRALTAR
jgi:hypothetical protein